MARVKDSLEEYDIHRNQDKELIHAHSVSWPSYIDIHREQNSEFERDKRVTP